jgi:hypothetical protein
LIDGGHLHPQGLYALRPVAQQDYSGIVVKGLIVEKKLAPFYRGLEDYEEEWGEEEVITALKEVRASQAVQAEAEAAATAAVAASGTSSSGAPGGVDELGSTPGTSSPGGSTSGGGGSSSITAGSIKKGLKSAVSGVVTHKSALTTAAAQKEKEERERESRQVDLGERERKEARAYRGAVECPICFLVSEESLLWLRALPVETLIRSRSTIRPISTRRDAVNNPSVRNVLFRSRGRKRRSRI